MREILEEYGASIIVILTGAGLIACSAKILALVSAAL